MKYLLFVFFLALGFNSFCQSDNFLFIQAKKEEPFYVRIAEKTFNSSSFGHLVIPRISQEKLKLTIGYPRQSVPEQDFELTINGKNRGYELNHENGNLLFLYEWQTSTKILTTTPPAAKSGLTITGIKRTDPFALLMAGVVNDSLVLFTEKPSVKADVATAPAKKTVDSPLVSASGKKSGDSAVAANVKKDSPVSNVNIKEIKDESLNNVVKDSAVAVQKPEAAANEPFRRAITQTAEKTPVINDTLAKSSFPVLDSTSIVDITDKKQDSVIKEEAGILPSIVLIEENSSPDEKRLVFQVSESKEKIDVIIKKDAEPVLQEIKSEIAEPNVANTSDSSNNKSGMVILNSDCQRIASDNDVDRLRIQMLKETNYDDRVFAARKIFRTQCFTVKQVTALTELFKDDASRYMFFDAAYPFVYDSGNFKSLISLLKEEYYINRFKALVRM